MQRIVNAQGLNMPKLGLGTWPMRYAAVSTRR